MDRDFLIKHRFWFLVAAYVPLAGFALLWLASKVAADISAEQERVAEHLRKVAERKDVKGPEEVKHKEKEAESYQGMQATAWQKAWAGQKDFMTWPAAVEDRALFSDGLFARQIQAVRGQAPAEDAPAAANQFAGTVKLVRPDYCKVEGAGAVEKTFRRTAALTVALSGAKGSEQVRPFSALREGDHVVVTYERGKFFGDKLTDEEKKSYRRSYQSQLAAVLKELDPVTADGRGSVVLWDDQAGKDWLYHVDGDGIPLLPPGATFFAHVAGPWKEHRFLSEEAWTAQEDLWIQRELFRTIRAANRRATAFARKDGPGELSGATAVFVSPFWEVELALTADRKGITGKVTNRLGRRQKADGVTFLVQVAQDAEPERIFLSGEPLVPGASRDLPAQRLSGGRTAADILGLEQALTWETVPIRRLDHVLIGAGQRQGGSAASTQSHRTFPGNLVAFPFHDDRKDDDDAEQAPSGSGRLKLSDTVELPWVRTDKYVPQRGGGRPAAPQPASPNGVICQRYVEVTPQVRRVPVALVLIVDEQYVGEVVPVFANGPLRFLTTQVTLHRYPLNVRPQAAPPAGSGGGFPSGPPPGLPGWAPPFRGSLQPPRAAAGPAEDVANNVELVLYGIVSLYGRYPPRGQ